MNKLNAENEDIQKDNSKSVSEKAESKFKLEAAQADYKVKDAEFKYAQQLQANASQALDYAKKIKQQ
ncbi:hypothetical protein [Holzapfeliella floricola]|uniref:hypothetical protein n=1 Tax=Holzapfeliella floricola TaxID=679249 RepID=UPI000AD6A5A2|nr:hypothetical protein [Holzapfeliella floricola]